MQQIVPNDVKVKILLSGGHEYTVYLKSDAPLLHHLFTVLTDPSQQQGNGDHRLFQIPLNQGSSALCFSSQHLVGLVTEPAIFLPAPQAAKAQATNVLASDYVQIDNFLNWEEREQLINYVLARESEFVSTTTASSDQDYRKSMVLHSFPEFSQVVVNRIKAIVPDVFHKLGIPLFSVSQIEAQLTAHNDGNYYNLHNDNGSPDTATREISYVYYFYREPKSFSGGELRIYDSKIENNFYVKAESFKTVEPRNNSIVFFLSRYLHEVLPVSCPSQAFADSRFTINGWVRKSKNS